MKTVIFLFLSMFPFLLMGQTSSKFCPMGKRLDSVQVFLLVEEMPEYDGDYRTAYEAMENHLDLSNLTVPKKENYTSYVSFIVDPNGQVIEACVFELPSYNGVISEYDLRAIEFVNTLKYTPGKQNNEVKYVLMNMQIVFDSKKVKKNNRKNKN